MINSPQNACMSCFTQHAAPINPCPVCGYNEMVQDVPPHILRPRTILNGKYLLGKVLGQGGFGITYIGWDLNLDIKVAIKEYYLSGFVTREAISVGSATVQPFTGSQGDFFLRGREKFVSEAKTLAKFFTLPGIVSIKDYFQENGTAYISMEYIDGQTLKEYLEKMSGRLPANQVFDLMKPVMYSLAEVHNAGLIHRDISPDNIMISKEGQMKLLDFGAARDFSDSGNKSMSIMLKPGFAPEEQYRSRGVQGPWTDVYALSATIYKCITGVTPDESVERVRADYVQPPSMLGIPVDPAQEAALMRGMAVQQDNRYQNVTELYYALYEPQSAASAPVYTSTAAPIAASTAPIATSPPVAAAQAPYTSQAQAAPPVFVPATAKPKMTKKKWIIAITCSVVTGLLLWQYLWYVPRLFADMTDDPATPAYSPLIELPVTTEAPTVSASPEPNEIGISIVGTWGGIVVIDDDSQSIELTFGDNGWFYLLESYPDRDNFFVYEGTYELSGSHIQMTYLWETSINDFWDTGYLISEIAETSVETYISIDADTLFIGSLWSGWTYEAVLSAGVPSVLWSFEHRENLINKSTEYYPGDWLRTYTDVTGYPLISTRVTGYGAGRVEADILEYVYDYSVDAFANYQEYLLSIGFTLRGDPRTESNITSYEYVRDIILVDISHGATHLVWLIVRFSN